MQRKSSCHEDLGYREFFSRTLCTVTRIHDLARNFREGKISSDELEVIDDVGERCLYIERCSMYGPLLPTEEGIVLALHVAARLRELRVIVDAFLAS